MHSTRRLIARRLNAFGLWAAIFLGAFALSSCKTSQVAATGGNNSGGKPAGGSGGGHQATGYAADISKMRIKPAPSDAYEAYTVHSHQFMESAKASGDVQSKDHINNALAYKLTVMREERENIVEAMGYKVLIFSNSNLKAVEEQAAKLEEFLKGQGIEEKIPVEYNAPNYVVKYGSFVSRLKAYEFFYRLKTDFPQAVVISERVKIIK